MSDLPRKLKLLSKKMLPELMITARVEIENFIQKNFDDEGFNDKGVKKWEARKRPRPQKILTQSRKLADTLQVKINGKSIQVTSPLPYAEIHNRGGKAGRNSSVIIPQRKFIDESETLNDILDAEFEKIIEKALN